LTHPKFTLREIVSSLGGEAVGEVATPLTGVATLDSAGPSEIAFLANPKYRHKLGTTRAGAVIVGRGDRDAASVPRIVCDNPYAYYARTVALFHPEDAPEPGIHPFAQVDGSANVDASAEIGAFVVIGAQSSIGPGARVGAHSVLGERVTIGEGTRLHPRVTLYDGCTIGARCILHSGVVIGADGFGMARDEGRWIKIPQVGSVRIGDDVEVGANTTIDRGALDDTVIEEGVKIDNLIMIAHNVRIGAHSALAAAVAIAGSSVVGKRCVLAGRVGLSGHVTLCDDVVVLGTSFISHSINKPGVYSSALPSEEAGTWRRIVGRIKRLDSMAKRLRAVEKHVGFSAIDRDSSED